MSCDKYREQIPLFVAGALDQAARQAVAAHTGTCSACAEELRVMGDLQHRLDQELKAWVGAGEPPPDLETQLRAVVRQTRAIDVAEVLAEGAETPLERQRRLRERRGGARHAWMTAAAAAAVAALMFINMPVGKSLTRAPGLGSVVALFRGEDAQAAPDGGIPVHQSATLGAVTLTVQSVRHDADQTLVLFGIRGAAPGPGARQSLVSAVSLVAGSQPLPLKSVAFAGSDLDQVAATFGPAPPGAVLSLRLEPVPGAPAGALVVQLPVRP